MNLCGTCPHKTLQHCNLTNQALNTLTACPEGRWGSRDLPRKKVLWISGDFAKGGITRYTVDLFRILRDLPIDFHVLYFSEHHFDQYSHEDITCPVTKVSESDCKALIAWADHISVANVNTQWEGATELVSQCQGKLFGQIHGTCDWSANVCKFVKRYSDKIMVCSRRALQILPPGDYFCPPTPIDWCRVMRQRPKKEAQATFNLPEGAKLAVVASRISHDKNLPGIATAVAEVPGLYLLCVGSGYAENDVLPQMYDRLGHRFLHRPWVRTPTDYLDAADCFMVLSPNEGVPLSAVEAMAHGTPLVAKDVGDIFSYRLCLAGGFDRSVAYLYDGPSSIERAMAGVDAVTQQQVFSYIQQRHSHHLIREQWSKYLN